jgi:4-hydroxybenzoate polyprenyltransferase
MSIRSFGLKILIFLEMIKFEHSVFALPFALTGALLAAGGWPPLDKLLWIVAAAVFARTAAMSFNRWADAHIDAQNPRTQNRAIPQGKLSPQFALAVTVGCSAAFVFSAWKLNMLAFYLSPLALLILLGYSYTKRITSLSHVILGLALGLAPAGAWIAIRGSLDLPPVLLAIAVICWTAGFDLIYSCQDYDFDRKYGLYSIPARYGVRVALRLSSFLHACTILFLVLTGITAHCGVWYYLGVVCVAGLLYYDHLLVHPEDLSRLEAAFFTVNSWVGVVVFAFTLLDFLL